MLKAVSLIICTLILSSCASTEIVPMQHPSVMLTNEPKLPHFTRDLIDCSKPELVKLCKLIVRREALLKQALVDQMDLVRQHNKQLEVDK